MSNIKWQLRALIHGSHCLHIHSGVYILSTKLHQLVTECDYVVPPQCRHECWHFPFTPCSLNKVQYLNTPCFVVCPKLNWSSDISLYKTACLAQFLWADVRFLLPILLSATNWTRLTITLSLSPAAPRRGSPGDCGSEFVCGSSRAGI